MKKYHNVRYKENKMIDSIKVGKKITALRKEAKMTQDDLASKLFTSRQNVSKWEIGASYPTIDSLVEMSKIFSITIEDILCLNEEYEINENNLFKDHSRDYVLKEIITGRIKINLKKVLFQFTKEERLCLLKAIKDGKLDYDYTLLKDDLTNEEKALILRR